MQAKRAVNTIRAYKCSWRTFEIWCATRNRQSLPANSSTLRQFILYCISDKKRKLTTIEGHVAAIRAKHRDAGYPSPFNEATRELLRSSARRYKQKPVKKHALKPEHLREIARYLDEVYDFGNPLFGVRIRAVRDRAIILIGFNSGWRRSELASLTMDDIAQHPQGIAVRLTAGSKTDQAAQRERIIGIKRLPGSPMCAVQALEEWVRIRGDWPGALFTPIGLDGKIRHHALSGDTVCHLLKRALKRIGIDPKPFGAHSMRAGMITAAARNGAAFPAIQDRSGHASLQVMMGYIRSENLFASDPLHGVLEMESKAS